MTAEKRPTGAEPSIFIEEVHAHQARYKKIIQFTHSATKAAGIMLLAAIVALVIANTGVYESFEHAIHQNIGFILGDATYTMSISHVINDILMAIFFLLVGLEIKYEMTVGELTNIRQALLPIVAACGGVLMPIVIYLFFNMGHPDTVMGWGVPTATDIAFALGIMALLGNRVPIGVRVFLSTLAVADDIIAILVIAIFYGQTPSIGWLVAAAGVMVVLVLMNRSHMYSLVPYLLVGVVLWFCVYMSGVHSTIAGVLLAFAIPSGSRINLKGFIAWSDKKIRQAYEAYRPDEPVIGQKEYMREVKNLSAIAAQVIPPATRLEHKLYPWVYFAILPLFALTNADVHLATADPATMLGSPVFTGVFFGLLLGKPIGILLFSFIVVKTGLASLPANVNWHHMIGAAVLGGVGFTMAIFVANLAFDNEAFIVSAKAAILSASTLAGVVGFLFLFIGARSDAKRGVLYVANPGEDGNMSVADAESRLSSMEVMESFGHADRAETKEAMASGDRSEVAVCIDAEAYRAHQGEEAEREGVR